MTEVRWDRAFTSPLVRARRTAEVVLAGRTDAPPLTPDARLVEMDFGPYEGWTDAELEADPVAVTRRRDGAELAWVESQASVEARVRAFYDEITGLPGRTLVVGHGRTLRILIAACVLEVPASVAANLRMRNCRPAIVEPGSPSLLLGFNLGAPGTELAR